MPKILSSLFCSLVLTFAALSGGPVFGAAPATITVIAAGSGASKTEALQNAWLEAVRKAVGLYMTAKTEINDDELNEKIIAHSRGQVDSWKILSETQNNGVWDVAIEASIEKDVLQEATAQSKSQKMTFDGSQVVAKEDTQAKKKESAKEIIEEALNNLDLAKILRYQAQIKKTTQGDKTVFYVQNNLSIDPAQFKIAAQQLEKTLSPIAIGKQTMKIEEPWGKNVTELLKNWTYAPQEARMSIFLPNLSEQEHRLHGVGRHPSKFPPANSICFFRNAAKAECYIFDKDAMKQAIKNVKRHYEIRFEAESGEDFSEISDALRVEWPYNFYGTNIIYIDPTFEDRGTDVANLLYCQPLDLSQEQMLELKEITGKYEIVKE